MHMFEYVFQLQNISINRFNMSNLNSHFYLIPFQDQQGPIININKDIS